MCVSCNNSASNFCYNFVSYFLSILNSHLEAYAGIGYWVVCEICFYCSEILNGIVLCFLSEVQYSYNNGGFFENNTLLVLLVCTFFFVFFFLSTILLFYYTCLHLFWFFSTSEGVFDVWSIMMLNNSWKIK